MSNVSFGELPKSDKIWNTKNVQIKLHISREERVWQWSGGVQCFCTVPPCSVDAQTGSIPKSDQKNKKEAYLYNMTKASVSSQKRCCGSVKLKLSSSEATVIKGVVWRKKWSIIQKKKKKCGKWWSIKVEILSVSGTGNLACIEGRTDYTEYQQILNAVNQESNTKETGFNIRMTIIR